MELAAVPMPLLLAAIITVAGCFLILLLLVSFNAKASRRITRLLVNLCTIIYGMRDQAPKRSCRQSPAQKDGGRKRGAP